MISTTLTTCVVAAMYRRNGSPFSGDTRVEGVAKNALGFSKAPYTSPIHY
jgi:hypothetical protein